MANTLIVKRSSVAGKVPLSTDLQVGELAVNLADQKIYSKNAGGTVVQLGGGAGSGDVVGPASATDNALVRFDGTTGKLVQNSTATLDDTGNMDTASLKADYFDLDTAATAPANAVGREAWDDGYGTPIVGLKGGNVTYYYGQQEFARVYNGSGAAMSKGQVVYIVGAQGNRIDVRLARANAEATSANTIGFVAEAIANGAEGWVQTTGPIPQIDTSTLTAGQTLYLSPTTAGAYTTTKPAAPDQLVIVGFVERVHASVGSIYIKVNNGYELDELHDVLITSPASGNTLIYDASTAVWKNANISAGSGVSVTNGAGSITIANTAPDQTVALTGAGATTITGTYPNFTISSVNTTYSLATSTVLGLIELGSNTQQTVAANAVSATASRSYALQVNAAGQGVVNVPWTDTNSGGTVTSVGGTGSVSGLTLTGTVTTSGNLTLGGTLAVTPSDFASQTANTVLAAPNGAAGVPTFRAIVAADIPTLNQNTTGTAANVTGTVAVANGGTGATTAAAARTNLGATTLGGNLFTLANVAAIAFPRFNADNTVSSLDAATFRTAIGAGTGSGNGTVTSVAVSGGTTGLTTSGGPITTSGTITLAGTLAVANGGTGLTTIAARSISVANAANTYTTVTPAAGQSVRVNAGNTAWEAYTPGTGTVTSVGGTGTVSGLSLSGTVTTSGNLTLGGTLAVTPSNFASQTANTFLAAPNGAAGVPTFRAMVAADVPTLNQNTTGTAANVTGTVAVANGGTGATTAANALTNLGAYAASNPSGYITTAGARSAVSFTAGSGAYNSTTGVFTIPTNTNQLTNGAGFGTGTVTSVSGTGTVSGLTLSGTVTTSGSLTLGGTLSVAALSTASGSAPSYSARAWVNFQGTGTVTIRASGNVSSITDNGTGDYTPNFTTAMPDVNYAVVANAAPSDNQRNNVTIGLSANGAPTLAPESNTKFVGSFRMQTGLPGSTTFVDQASVYVACFR
jgi:hypothetical protein